MFSHDFIVMSIICAIQTLSVDYVIFMSWNIFLFYSLLERFCTSFQVYHKTSCVFLHFGRVFNYAKIIFKLIFQNPFHQRAVGWATMPYLLKSEIYLNMCMNRVVSMSYTLDPHYISIGITIDIFMFVYSYFCVLYMYALNFNQYQFQLIYSSSYIYI